MKARDTGSRKQGSPQEKDEGNAQADGEFGSCDESCAGALESKESNRFRAEQEYMGSRREAYEQRKAIE